MSNKRKITFISSVTTPERAYENIPELKDFDVKFFQMHESSKRILAEAPDTEFIIADAMGRVDGELIGSLKSLKLIQSEGVGYQGIDLERARACGVTVCNNKGINDTAVAECCVFLILACLKNYENGVRALYDGKQIEAKKAAFGVTRELSECTVGLVGFGDIARCTARLLNVFGARVIYTNRTRKAELEREYNVEYVDLDTLIKSSDFVSLHLASCEETRNTVNASFLSKMKKSAYLINTARGDLVDNEALYNALKNGEIAGAGLDVISPEPVLEDNILLSPEIKDKLALTPHIAGITSLTVKKLYRQCFENIIRVINDEEPINIVL